MLLSKRKLFATFSSVLIGQYKQYTIYYRVARLAILSTRVALSPLFRTWLAALSLSGLKYDASVPEVERCNVVGHMSCWLSTATTTTCHALCTVPPVLTLTRVPPRQVRATDGGSPSKSSLTRVLLSVLPERPPSPYPPLVTLPVEPVPVFENEPVGHLVQLVTANTTLLFSIAGEARDRVGRDGTGRVGSGRVGSGWVGSGRVGS